jgi:hypothetical protein
MYSFVSCWVPLEGVLFDIKGRGGERRGEERRGEERREEERGGERNL